MRFGIYSRYDLSHKARARNSTKLSCRMNTIKKEVNVQVGYIVSIKPTIVSLILLLILSSVFFTLKAPSSINPKLNDQ